MKNWSLNTIQGIHSNGLFTILNKSDNPLQQVRKHADDLKGYLLSNHPCLGDPHKLIRYVTIQFGFNKGDIGRFTKDWDLKNSNDFFAFHLFKDDLDYNLEKRLASASKFRTNALSNNLIEDIVSKIRISNKKLSESDINLLIRSEEIDRTANELKELTKKTEQMIEEQRKFTTAQNTYTENYTGKAAFNGRNSENKKRRFIPIIIIILGIAILYLISLNNIGSNSLKNNNETYVSDYRGDLSPNKNEFLSSDLNQAFLKQGNLVKATAKVESFQYDNSSGNKFLRLEADDFTFNAIILKETKTLYIDEGTTYIFYGVTQEYEGQIELKVTKVE